MVLKSELWSISGKNSSKSLNENEKIKYFGVVGPP